jgi:hypothetical protein
MLEGLTYLVVMVHCIAEATIILQSHIDVLTSMHKELHGAMSKRTDFIHEMFTVTNTHSYYCSQILLEICQ